MSDSMNPVFMLLDSDGDCPDTALIVYCGFSPQKTADVKKARILEELCQGEQGGNAHAPA
jgi:hypothetical protein